MKDNEKQSAKEFANQSATEQTQKEDQLSKEEKEKLQVKDGQNNHHLDERGGY
ncbi:hypothetical protein MHH33_14005 [Paenisporosarcina sp. FSL H8-0542]|uniref:hypothetical protein n=1 Tax=unclassified Paenisporosarcina TaxID=2642018 RepID=UPI00034E5AD9|nr:hypothetical protein [Paenisporosarcina sp. HGH0030]EPD52271.1 hypothetical protein HMPREF1210_01624 [Paenisporosarcina sp. HGH0030]